FDMHGNVWEWCADHWHKNYADAPVNNKAWISRNDNDNRLLRGGSWHDHPRGCRSAYRGYGDPDYRYDVIGFRVVVSVAEPLL
ncbi:MAG: formylglycine-generating enzyme family protein, partial [Scytonema sp. PMC 1069.18]|nr:formylglycine-generating enzyme family protein [Scytonema sp. PMC 1069.18]